MNNPFLLQFFGILLAIATAVGCIAYEKIVYAFSYSTIALIIAFETVLALLISLFFVNNIAQDWIKLQNDVALRWSVVTFILTGITGFCWYYVTKTKGVMAGSIFEVKYLLILALFYFFCGTNPMTINTILGLIFSMLGIYFITR
jgi:drug/metabolite transporter (DMT)-like permease